MKETSYERRERLRRARSSIVIKSTSEPEPIKIGSVLKVLSMILFAHIFGGN
jgi:hypothetical protein